MSAPWLLIDAGNSRIKWALAPGRKPAGWRAAQPAFLASGAVAHAQWRSLAGDIRAQWPAPDTRLAPPLGATPGLPIGQPDRPGGIACPAPAGVWVSNVAGEAADQAVRVTLQTLWGVGPPAPLNVLRSTAAAGGIVNRYADPSQLGTDRWASLIGAHAAFPGEHLLIVTLGTATTVEALTSAGEFLGGVIAPGPALMLSSLAQGTAQLPNVTADTPALATGFAVNTHDALISGCLGAQAGLVERCHASLQRDLGGAVRCVLAGGARRLLAPMLSIPFTEHDHLVLAGLYEIAVHPATGGDR
ncbi:type III pantothenate kinase [Pandoraea terrae]|uniref:Type III pantothenate kinase n=1 Tax=Pandoraea terrae TaxID=1537710 RepID=A0A5E4YFP8_9BURK|nr:type III pantothenate kinase [Pandoraea terrae]VVE46923.1 type III pantothenate kinase [Pandoraea terrae]